jgi:hypothetical protein
MLNEHLQTIEAFKDRGLVLSPSDDETRDPPSSGADGPTVQFSGTGTVVGTVPLQQDVQYSRSKR